MRFARAFCLASLLPLSLSSPAAHAKTIVVEREVPAAVSVGGAPHRPTSPASSSWSAPRPS
jgi:hypothetical protein